MKGEILLKALNLLEEGAMNQVDFFNAVLESGYGASMSKLEYQFNKQNRKRNLNKSKKDELRFRKKRLSVFISKMKHDGLICGIKNDGNSIFISQKGKQKLNILKNSLPSRQYKAVKQTNSVIISFDIPERLRRKRNWLREVIKNLGFEMIHQSVWVGKIKIPIAMITDLESLKILEFIEIFEVTRTGSLTKVGKF